MPCKKCCEAGFYWVEDAVGKLTYHLCEDCKGEGFIKNDEVEFKKWRVPIDV